MKRAVGFAWLAVCLWASTAVAAEVRRRAPPAGVDSASVKRAAVPGAPAVRARPQASAERVRRRRDGALDGLGVEPLVAGSRDSDGNRMFTTGLGADLPVGRGVRLGPQASRTRVEDDVSVGIADELRLRAFSRTPSAWRFEAATGVARLAPAAGDARFEWTGGLRARWRAARGSPSGELRVERAPLAANQILLGHHVMRNDGRVALELPVRAVRVRGAFRRARIESAGERNAREQLDAAIALPVSPAVTPFVQYRTLGYEHAASIGYFAPRRVEIVETGSSFALGRGAPWLLSLELGAGIQRIDPFGGPPGAWGPSLRGYGYLSFAAGRCEVRLEAEDESTPGFGGYASEDWRYRSLSVALRWARP